MLHIAAVPPSPHCSASYRRLTSTSRAPGTSSAMAWSAATGRMRSCWPAMSSTGVVNSLRLSYTKFALPLLSEMKSSRAPACLQPVRASWAVTY